MNDPRAEQEDTRAALSDPVYVQAFSWAMTGREAELTDKHRAAIQRARDAAGADVGYPMPIVT